MRIGLISDIHGNLPALEAVLADMPDVEIIVHAGDLVGYGPYPTEVVEQLKDSDIRSIQGNHDLKISSDLDGLGTVDNPDAVSDTDDRLRQVVISSGRWTREQLNGDELDYLASLPKESVCLNGEMRVAHGAPGDQEKRIQPDDYSSRLLGTEKILVLGHSHVQAGRRFDDKLIINPGSVGLPRDGDNRAAYAVLETDKLEFELKRVEYPIADVQTKLRETTLPAEIAEWIATGEVG